jgi:hypothetical protein
MKRTVWTMSLLIFVQWTMVTFAQAPQPTQAPPRVDMTTMVRPIDMHDSVWMAELTELENRDLIKSGKTTALVTSGGVEGNGPYMILDKHNIRARIVS